ncbi:hypothetical protein Asppvi_001895 [Aspergillus pseudoviridinutans]|uniref:Rhodopsin domain-containing protein n=1 Tax=Aspergillus pseudoviridinutans TaxID=1517512 RepID=A0A9P3F0K9_9EURO|nr:uncharacterized protein Asppvi_001895 [Aspergillus pseudoviridinutans]GIJ92617.1 hypothetical protein Asppvi_001895 [Aspergillus pseudoviridinutans]
MADHVAGAGLPDDNRGPAILAATSTVTICALLTVLARMYVRVFMIRNVGADDYTMLLTMVLSLAGWAIIIPEVIYGAGRHTVYVMDTAIKANQLNFATQGIYMWAIGLVKISIGLFLLRFAPRKGYKIFIWVIIVLMSLYTTICFFTLIFQCQNIRTIWDPSVKSKCFKPTQLLELSYTNTALNILTDLIFAIMPAIMLRHLQVNRRVKASLVCILGLGVFACAAAFVKVSILPNYGRTGDFLWDYTDLTIWVVVECNTGIVAGSLPTLKPLFKQALGSYGSRPSHSHSRNYSRGTRYKLRSLSRQNQSKPQTLPSGNFDGDTQVQRKGPLTYQSAYETTTTATYPGGEGSNSSEEHILSTGGEGIVCVTEVMVSHSQESGKRLK